MPIQRRIIRPGEKFAQAFQLDVPSEPAEGEGPAPSAAKREFSGYAVTFGDVVDAWIPTIVEPGAFNETITQWQASDLRMPLLWDHNPGDPRGNIRELREDDKGLWFRALVSNIPEGNRLLEQILDETVRQMSIGLGEETEGTVDEVDGQPVLRHLTKIPLREISAVMFPAASTSRITEVTAAPSIGDALFAFGGIGQEVAEVFAGRQISAATRRRFEAAIKMGRDAVEALQAVLSEADEREEKQADTRTVGEMLAELSAIVGPSAEVCK